MKPSAAAIGLALGFTLGSLPGLAQGQPTAPSTLYRHHFAGAAQVAQAAQPATPGKIWKLPETVELRGHILQRLAQVPYRAWRRELPAGATDQSALFHPLLEDAINAESYLEVRGPIHRTETVLAVRLTAERAAVWSTNLWRALAAWKLGTPNPIRGEGFQGWELKKKGAPNLIQLARAGAWLLVGLGHDRLTLLPALAQQAAQTGSPAPKLGGSWFEADVDFPQLSQRFPALRTWGLAPAHLAVAPSDDSVRATVQLRYPEKTQWNLEPWRVPTNQVGEPLISFTAARGIAPLAARLKGVPELGLKPTPNQICLWGQMHEHVQSCFAVPVPKPTNTLMQLLPRLKPLVHHYLPGAAGNFIWLTNRSEVFWSGLPFLFPVLRPITDGGKEYVLGSLYPLPLKQKAVPAELFAQLASSDSLLYYDWEITGARLTQSIRLFQLMSIITSRRVPATNAPTVKWAGAVAPLLGNTGTKITQTGAGELTLVRSSHIGLTGFELATLLRWVESPGFPLTFEPPPPVLDRSRKRTAKPAAAKPVKR